jgi:PAS domain S-box-containing protein
MRILIVDDSDDDAQLIVRHLKKEWPDLAWTRAETEDEICAALADTQHWNVVLCDYQMPCMTVERCRDLMKANAPAVPMIVVSGSIGEEAAVDLMRMGVADIVMKDRLFRLAMIVQRTWKAALERTEKAQVEYKFQQLYNETPVMLHSIDRDSRIAAVSDFWLEKLGYRRDEVIGHKLVEFMTPTSADHAERVELPNFFRNGVTSSKHYEFIRKSGGIMHVRLSAVADRNSAGTIIGSLAVLHDATAEVEISEKLGESEERFRQAFKSAGHGMSLMALDGSWMDMNEKLAEMVGYDRAELLSMNWRDLTCPQDIPGSEMVLTRMLAGEFESHQWEKRYIRKDGSVMPVMISMGLIRDSDGAPSYTVVQAVDLSALKAAEANFAQSQKMEAVGNLTGGIAHDFNNILGIILGNLQLLQRRLGPNPSYSSFVEDAIDVTRRGADLTRQLLAFSRHQELEPKILHPKSQIAIVLPILRRTLGTHIRIETDIAADLDRVKVDPIQLESALINLCINSRDAMADGGNLTIAASNVTIDRSYIETNKDAKPGRYVRISVRDDGHGMSRETAAKIFDPFFTTKDIGKGTGLGLSMVYGFAKQSGGHAGVYSEEGEGTIITMYLPSFDAHGDVVPDQGDATGADILQHGKGTVLLVEDEPQFRRITALQLEDLGYTVIAASDGSSALESLRTYRDIDLLLTDMVMPGGLNGHQLADLVRKEIPDLPVLLSSGFPRDAFADGRSYPLLQKPYTEIELARAVHNALARVPEHSEGQTS